MDKISGLKLPKKVYIDEDFNVTENYVRGCSLCTLKIKNNKLGYLCEDGYWLSDFQIVFIIDKFSK